MSRTDLVFAALLFAALVLITIGASWFSTGAGLITGGVSLAGWSWLVFTDDGEPG